MDQFQNIEELFRKYLKGEYSRESLQILIQQFNDESNEDLLKRLIQVELEGDTVVHNQVYQEVKAKLDDVFQQVKKGISRNK